MNRRGIAPTPRIAGLVRLAGRGHADPVVDVEICGDIVSATVYAILGAFQFAAGFRRRRHGWHRAWMTRGYAIGLGAGTQVFTQLPWLLFIGPLGELPRTC